MTPTSSHAVSYAELLAVTQRIESLLAAQTQILERLTIAEVESTHRDRAIAQLVTDVSELRKAQHSNSILIAKAAGAVGLAGMVLPQVVRSFFAGG